MKDEKRREKRFAKHFSTEFISDGQMHTGIWKDLSLDGLFIKTRKPLDIDKTIEMILYLPDGSTSKLTGRVVRAVSDRHTSTLLRAGLPSKNGMGIQLRIAGLKTETTFPGKSMKINQHWLKNHWSNFMKMSLI